ncbi:MmgE/PrpD family protein [Nereida sp. MMG025]|uniref:MmgE/PrpD family protein n=1 Tax=Nereida sp. MMG025 TaxID=2909981 RepID=UPI001F2581D5|nr:MmgE/PrpD family protein [Nereida sp. MMG025]MCF6443265.1 MmgE/PrpD family protein [Nereida sp. MMG025]
MGITEHLVELCSTVHGGPLTDPALDVMRLSVLDWAAVAIAGRAEPVARIIAEVEMQNGGAAQASVVGRTTRLPMRGAAMVNGTAAHALDFDDTHFAHIGHPSAVIVSAVLAMAEHADAQADAFLRAALVGAEATVRVGVWLGRTHYEAGFHQTATAGMIGAAVAGAALFELDAVQTRSAIGLAATRAAGLKLQFGTMGKPYHAGMAAAGAVEAVHAAKLGLDGAQEVLDGPFGFGANHHGAGDMSAFASTEFLFAQVSHKFHACCHGTHAAIEALIDLRPDCAPEHVRSVEITVHPRWFDVCNIASPQTRLEAKFSLRLTAALALMGRAMTSDLAFEPSVILAPDVVALRDCVTVLGDEALRDTQARVRVTTRDGMLEAEHDLAVPAPFAARLMRVQEKAEALIGRALADEIWSALSAGATVDIPALTAALRQ